MVHCSAVLAGGTSIRYELSDATHAATDSAVSEHDSVGFWPVGLSQCDGFAIQVGKLEGPLEILERFVSVRKRFYQATQFIWLKSLFQARIASSGPSIAMILMWRITIMKCPALTREAYVPLYCSCASNPACYSTKPIPAPHCWLSSCIWHHSPYLY
jgi:hypothetical protein